MLASDESPETLHGPKIVAQFFSTIFLMQQQEFVQIEQEFAAQNYQEQPEFLEVNADGGNSEEQEPFVLVNEVGTVAPPNSPVEVKFDLFQTEEDAISLLTNKAFVGDGWGCYHLLQACIHNDLDGIVEQLLDSDGNLKGSSESDFAQRTLNKLEILRNSMKQGPVSLLR